MATKKKKLTKRAASDLASTRWTKKEWRSRKRRKEFGAFLATFRKTPETKGGRPRDPNRCPCGRFTVGRAKQRNHKCSKAA